MSIINIKFFSELVHQNVQYNVIIPEKADVKTSKVIYLLHGLYGDSFSWLISGNAKDTAEKYNVILVMPDGYNSFYINHKNGYQYFEHIAYEVIDHAKSIFTLTGSWYIAGLSMGGFGAMMIGLKNDIFKAIGSFSGALLPKKAIKDLEIDFLNDVYEAMTDEYDLLTLLKSKNDKYPFIYTYCGKNDELFQMNLDFSEILPMHCEKYVFESDDGTHSWEMWSKCLEIFINKI